MACQRCSSSRVLETSFDLPWLVNQHMENKCLDHELRENEVRFFLPSTEFMMEFCLDCGQIQGEWPHKLIRVEKILEEIKHGNGN